MHELKNAAASPSCLPQGELCLAAQTPPSYRRVEAGSSQDFLSSIYLCCEISLLMGAESGDPRCSWEHLSVEALVGPCKCVCVSTKHICVHASVRASMYLSCLLMLSHACTMFSPSVWSLREWPQRVVGSSCSPVYLILRGGPRSSQ